MQIIELSANNLRFLDALSERSPAENFIWIYLEREEFEKNSELLQQAAEQLGGSALLDLHAQDLCNSAHPSHYDSTSIYDLIIFRRLASLSEAKEELQNDESSEKPSVFAQIQSRAVGFAVFDRLLISVHPRGCYAAKNWVQRYLSDVKLEVGAGLDSANHALRSRLPQSPADLALRMINSMVDSYLELRKEISNQLEKWQTELLRPTSSFNNWNAVMSARSQLHLLEDLCQEQQDAMQEWTDTLREQPLSSLSTNQGQATQERDQLLARARDVMEHIERVMRHAQRLEQSAETAVQIHFAAQGQRTNDIMRVLTALTAIFLPLNFITGVFGMNFEFLPFIHSKTGHLWTFAAMFCVAIGLLLVFWRKRYLARTRK